MGFCVKMPLHGTNALHFFATLLFISSVLNTWTGTKGWSYHHSDSKMDWKNARKWCKEHFTDMVAIQNKEEIFHLNDVLPKVQGHYWIGIRKINEVWTWVGTNKILTDEAENWATSEPNGKNNNEDCVEIYIKRLQGAGKWNDETCSKQKTALCYTASCKKDYCVSGCGECVEMINNHTCSCFRGFYGDRCENVVKCNPEAVTTIYHGNFTCSNPNGNFSYGSQCEYYCNEGYKLKGSSMMRCRETATWSNKPPSCELVQCPELFKPNNGTMDCHHDSKGNFSYQSTCQFACQEGFTLGKSSSSMLFCDVTGHWNHSQPSCEIIKCKSEDIAVPDHGHVRCFNPNGNFSFDSVCEYSCEEGYELKGSTTTRCSTTTEWTNKPPSCELVHCPELIRPNNGTIECNHDPKDNFSYQSTCQFACQEGFKLGKSSSSTLFCDVTGHWNDSQPSCEVVKCNPEAVTTLYHGNVMCSNPNGNFSYGSQCEYSCNEGYELKGSSMMRCRETATWSNKPPSCELVQCPELFKPNNGTMDCHHNSKGNFSYQSSCEFACQEGFTLGKSSSSMLFCDVTGHWNHSQPSCEIIKCKSEDIAVPDHGHVRCFNPNGNFSFDSVCEYSCEEGYELKGSTTTRCSTTTEWTNKPPSCELVHCPELFKPNNGTIECNHDPKDNFSYQSTCQFACQEGFKLGKSSSSTLFCDVTGHWNDSQPSCEVVKCNSEAVTTLYHGNVTCSNPNGNFSYGSQCEYSCNEGYELKGYTTTRCTATTEWTSKPPMCEPVECPQLHEPVNGYMNCTPLDRFFGTICNFSCHDGYQLHSNHMVMCSHNGNWSGEVAVCQAQPEPSLSAFKTTEVILGVAATVGSTSLLLVLWILKRLKKNANKFALNSKSDVGDPPQVYKNSLDGLI